MTTWVAGSLPPAWEAQTELEPEPSSSLWPGSTPGCCEVLQSGLLNGKSLSVSLCLLIKNSFMSGTLGARILRILWFWSQNCSASPFLQCDVWSVIYFFLIDASLTITHYKSQCLRVWIRGACIHWVFTLRMLLSISTKGVRSTCYFQL